MIDRAWARESDAWRDQAQKDTPRTGRSAISLEIARDGFTDVGEERDVLTSTTFAADDELARALSKGRRVRAR